MKIFLIISGVILLFFIITQFYAMRAQKNIETYPYVVTKKYDLFEIRNYEASLFTSVKLATNEYKNASSKGFSILGGYIFGDNEKKENIDNLDEKFYVCGPPPMIEAVQGYLTNLGVKDGAVVVEV
jgi:ferredoxin-NADP reductase